MKESWNINSLSIQINESVKFRSKGTTALGEFISNLKKLKRISIFIGKDNLIQEKGIKVLMMYLAMSKELVHLSLLIEENDIKKKGAYHIANYLL